MGLRLRRAAQQLALALLVVWPSGGMQRIRITAACVDMWEPFTKRILNWVSDSRIVFDKFHVMQHAHQAVDEVRRAEFFVRAAGCAD